MSKSVTCYICGKNKTVKRKNGFECYICPECKNDKEKQKNRIFTKDTVFLVCKWYNEGMSRKNIATVLKRSEESVQLALEKGGAV
ncbi:MAG: hypothetical protein ACI4YB_01915 [Oscillospiraceae bacterium]